jgi:CheY-like chemotaxis protein/HPt (histidine-containing phosphotransfer) domain-containing protein
VIDTSLEFMVDIDSDVQNELLGDEVRIRQVLLNLLSNAVKYTEKGSILLKVRNELTDDEDTVRFIIEVKDTGKGIREEDIGKLFSEFVQLDLEENKGIEGTGLGLSITKSLVKAMGGDIAVLSEYGVGSTFTVTLPQKVRGSGKFGDGSTDSYAVSEESSVKFIAPTARVLIVDDISTNLAVVEGLLLPYRVQMDSCRSGVEAIEAVTANLYDLVLMDHMMPVMDGIEATTLIRKMDCEYYAELPIIALTANALYGAKEMFLQNGFNDFLAKPIEIAKLSRILEKWIPAPKHIPVEENECGVVSDINIDIVIDGVDVRTGMARTGGTADGYWLTLAVFYKDGLEIVSAIKESLETDNMQKYITTVHGLKSAAANIGAITLSGAARDLEEAGKQDDRDFISKNTSALLSDLEALLLNINDIVSSRKEKLGQTDISVDLLKSALITLRTAIDDLDAGAINAAVKELRQFENAAKTGEATENILQNVLNGEYDEALALIETLLPDKENDS